MNRKRIVAGIAGAAWLWCGTSVLAADGGDRPMPPYIVSPGETAAWSITVQDKAPPSEGAPPSLRERQVVQSGGVRRESNKWSDGGQTENWQVNGIWMKEDPQTHTLSLIDPAHTAMAALILREAFLDQSWVGTGTYLRRDKLNGQPCFVYGRAAANGGAEGAAEEAWIAVDTRLIAFFDDGVRTYRFQYLPPPSSPPVLPPRFAGVYRKFQDDLNPLKIPQPPQ
ncbi:hypothetical protein SAMN05444156_0920 [Verrucomicrobium sp. GAS474]|uniref:hypothetical protein n=1 Tax=Verrucomicrobium sp. GAS474 TaxID=1882831 RepID=UPI00087D268B|nr:hypothetical protein [Verrucomicrobium sp. GAS474]SDT94029.1 hypothetical protein SAMN05444156_0920 [Verrucomicrobium sp. GAS474]